MSIDKLYKQRSGFTQVPNALICDPQLSSKAKAVYCYLYSRPDDWSFYVQEIAKNFKEGREAINNAINELQSHGWVAKEQVRVGGKFSHNEFMIYIEPIQNNGTDGLSTVNGKTVDGKTVNGKTVDGKSYTTNTNNTNTELNNTDSKYLVETEVYDSALECVEINPFDEFWSEYPKKVGKDKARTAWNKKKDKPSLQDIIKSVRLYSTSKTVKDGYVANPATWINEGRWHDEHQQANGVLPVGMNIFDIIGRGA